MACHRFAFLSRLSVRASSEAQQGGFPISLRLAMSDARLIMPMRKLQSQSGVGRVLMFARRISLISRNVLKTQRSSI